MEPIQRVLITGNQLVSKAREPRRNYGPASFWQEKPLRSRPRFASGFILTDNGRIVCIITGMVDEDLAKRLAGALLRSAALLLFSSV
jgi:hypothetical protein